MPRADITLTTLGKTLRATREQRRLTVETVAAKSGVFAAKLAAYEAGDEEVTLLEMCALAKAMGTTAEAIFADAGL